MEATSKRVRAWCLFTADDAKAAQKISALFTQGGDDYVVIRADGVLDDQGTYNLVVPVDVKDEQELKSLLLKLTAAAGPARVLRVVPEGHTPRVPHEADSFVASWEYDLLKLPEYFPPGRHHPHSPGANPWG